MSQQDANRVIDILGQGYAQESLNLRKKIAVLLEENERLKMEIGSIKKSNEEDGEGK